MTSRYLSSVNSGNDRAVYQKFVFWRKKKEKERPAKHKHTAQRVKIPLSISANQKLTKHEIIKRPSSVQKTAAFIHKVKNPAYFSFL